MKTIFKKPMHGAPAPKNAGVQEAQERLRKVAARTPEDVYAFLGTRQRGLTEEEVERARERYGDNAVRRERQPSIFQRLLEAFISPFTAILLTLAVVSAFTDVIFAEPGKKDPTTMTIIAVMVAFSGLLRFVQETKSGNAAQALSEMIHTTTCVERDEAGKLEIPLDQVVVGDIVHLAAGDLIPADMRLCFAKDLFISQSALTGESEPVEKSARPLKLEGALTDGTNLAFLGGNVISGSAMGVVVATGKDTVLGQLAKDLSGKPPKTAFDKGLDSVSWVLIRFMMVMAPTVFLLNGLTKGGWLEALLFAVSIAVGLTPQMLPMIVTTCLAKGAMTMSREKVIIKNLNSIQNLGSMDILCTDKTGTLTQDKVVLEYHLDIHGNEDVRVLRYAFLNSYYQTGLKNLLDVAIMDRTHEEQEVHEELNDLEQAYRKVDEIPFDFDRRRMSVVVERKDGRTQMITKGAVEEMLKACSFVEYDGETKPLDEAMRKMIYESVDTLNARGMRVIAVANKTDHAPVGTFSVDDERDMVLMGYLAFLDPPKETAAAAISALESYGVSVKVLTGDNDAVTRSICAQVGLNAESLVLGQEIDPLTDEQLGDLAEKTTVFAKLSPAQKARVVRSLRQKGHAVGYMGDGINDAAAMRDSDVGISVDTAVDIAKESASVILLEKDLMVLESGILEGRKTYANMIKYIKMTASSNFGNMLSVLAASAFLPFLPMAALHLILLNLVYDLSCTALPWDNVDREFFKAPKKWEALSITSFMFSLGPTSSVFDIVTYLALYFVVCPAACGGQLFHQLTDPAMKVLYVAVFQSGWFVESMWTQTLVIHMLRTPLAPFVKSRASAPLTLISFGGIAVVSILPYTPLGGKIGLSPLPGIYFLYLIGVVAAYMALVTMVKKWYIRKYGILL